MLYMMLGIGLAALSVGLLVFQFVPKTVSEDFEIKAGVKVVRTWSSEAKLFSLSYPAISMFLPFVSWLPAPKIKKKLGRVLISAGLDQDINADEMISFQLVLAFLSPLVLKYFFSMTVAIPVGLLVGLLYPLIWLLEKRKNRQAEIVRGLPGRVDMLALSMEAGLDFNSAVKQIINQYPDGGGPMIDELRVFNQNMRLGMSRNEALEELGERVDDSEIYSFVSVLVQADILGASVGETLKQQGEKLRKERFLKAERLGAAASQKMMIPMMIFIFPLMFAVIFAPFLIKMFYG